MTVAWAAIVASALASFAACTAAFALWAASDTGSPDTPQFKELVSGAAVVVKTVVFGKGTGVVGGGGGGTALALALAGSVPLPGAAGGGGGGVAAAVALLLFAALGGGGGGGGGGVAEALVGGAWVVVAAAKGSMVVVVSAFAQSAISQLFCSVASPSHDLPLWAFCWVTFLDFEEIPVPQVTEQAVHGDQSPH